jgi:hypothetical protein
LSSVSRSVRPSAFEHEDTPWHGDFLTVALLHPIIEKSAPRRNPSQGYRLVRSEDWERCQDGSGLLSALEAAKIMAAHFGPMREDRDMTWFEIALIDEKFVLPKESWIIPGLTLGATLVAVVVALV